MQQSPKNVDRRLIPRWRKIDATPSAELQSRASVPDDVRIGLSSRPLIAPYAEQNTLFTAIEKLNDAVVSGDRKGAEIQATYVLSSTDVAEQVRKIAFNYLHPPQLHLPAGALEIEGVEQSIREIGRLKKVVANNPYNIVARTDIARHYAQLGQYDHSRNQLMAALNLAPTSRFILRAACRLFVHSGEVETAASILAKSDLSDPWLMASFISVCDMANRPLPSLRGARQSVMDSDHSSQITELASALATLELKSGNLRQAKRLFERSIVAPNDNAVAQIQWASLHHRIAFEDKLLGTEMSFEARALHHYEKSEFEESLTQCLHWLADEPFSTRPAMLGSYIAAQFLSDGARSQKFAELGLRANHGNVQLVNNLAYAQAMQGHADSALRTIDSVMAGGLSNEEKVVLSATRGYALLKQGDALKGAEFYHAAQDLAFSSGLRRLGARVLLHHLSAHLDARTYLPADFIQRALRKIESLSAGDELMTREYKFRLKRLVDEYETEIVADNAVTDSLERWLLE